MDRLKKELELYHKTFSKLQKDDEMVQLNNYLYQLLQLKTIDELIGYYSVTKHFNISLKKFEKEMYLISNIDMLKSRLITYFTEELARKFKK